MPGTAVRAFTLAILSALARPAHPRKPGHDQRRSRCPLRAIWRRKDPVWHALPSGTLIEARIGNVNYAQTINQSTGVGSQDTRTHSLTGGNLNYGTSAAFQICGDDSATEAVEGSAEGDQIVFYVAGIQAAAQPSTVFLVDGSLRVDLTIPSLTAPTGIPAAPSTSACTVTGAPSAPTPEPIPGMTAWGLAVLGAVLAMLTALAAHRRLDTT